MKREFDTLRRRIEEDDVSLSIDRSTHPVTGESTVRIAINGAMTEEVDSEFDRMKEEYKDLAESIYEYAELYEENEISNINCNWNVGKLLIESEDDNFPNLRILGEILPRGYSADSLSVCKQLYKAFPDQNYDEDSHYYSEIEEFIMQPTNNERGRQGYEIYKSEEYDWPKYVRRGWCFVNETEIDETEVIIDKFAEELKDRFPSDVSTGKEELATYLQEMVIVSTSIDREMEKEEAKEYIDNYF